MPTPTSRETFDPSAVWEQMSPALRVGIPADQREAIRRRIAGEQVQFSTGIDERMTYGYGRLDDYGFWEFPLRWEFLTPEQQDVVRDCDQRSR